MTMPSAPTDEIENERVSAVRRCGTVSLPKSLARLIKALIWSDCLEGFDEIAGKGLARRDDVYPLIADLIRAERTQHLVIAMPYTTQFSNASPARLHKGPRLRSN